jgi:DNA polymerase III subunit chi
MGIVMFYHLTRSPPEQTARLLLERAVLQGWKVMLRGTDTDRLGALDRALWAGPPESFLPHGLAGSAVDGDQPILLGTGPLATGRQALMLVDGADVSDNDIQATERVWVLFDGADPAALSQARLMWKQVTAKGHAAQYWSEESGRWEKKAG